MQMKTAMKYHYTPRKWVKSELTTPDAEESMEHQGFCSFLAEMKLMIAILQEDKFWWHLTKLNILLP